MRVLSVASVHAASRNSFTRSFGVRPHPVVADDAVSSGHTADQAAAQRATKAILDAQVTPAAPTTHAKRPHHKREVYIDAFRGLMALVMVQGHAFTALLSPTLQANPLVVFQNIFHGSTAPGFLFASGFVVGLPRAPLSLHASLRRAWRLLFIFGVGYFIHLPYFSLQKTLSASPAELAALFACDALQVIALTQLLVVLLQGIAGIHWTVLAGVMALIVMATSPWIWASNVATHAPLALGAYLDASSGSHFPFFPFATFVLAGTVAGAVIGRQEPRKRHRRQVIGGAALVTGGWLLSFPLQRYVDFWGPSPAYTLMRIGGLLLLLRLVELAADREWRGVAVLALLGHETLQVFVLHLELLYGGVLWPAPALSRLAGQLGLVATAAVLLAMLPVLFVAAWAWHRLKVRAPREASLLLVFLSTWFLVEYLTRPW
jgi:fucose 4-O-acetylase-like acetyltransferase